MNSKTICDKQTKICFLAPASENEEHVVARRLIDPVSKEAFYANIPGEIPENFFGRRLIDPVTKLPYVAGPEESQAEPNPPEGYQLIAEDWGLPLADYEGSYPTIGSLDPPSINGNPGLRLNMATNAPQPPIDTANAVYIFADDGTEVTLVNDQQTGSSILVLNFDYPGDYPSSPASFFIQVVSYTPPVPESMTNFESLIQKIIAGDVETISVWADLSE